MTTITITLLALLEAAAILHIATNPTRRARVATIARNERVQLAAGLTLAAAGVIAAACMMAIIAAAGVNA